TLNLSSESKSTIARLDRLIDYGFSVFIFVRSLVVKSIGSLVISGGKFYAKRQSIIGFVAFLRVEQPISCAESDVRQTGRRGSVALTQSVWWIAAMFVHGCSVVINKRQDHVGVPAAGNTVSGRE